MGLKDVSIKDTYWSGEDNLIMGFYIPCLENSISYDRAVGFFNSSILQYICEGLYAFIKRGGLIRLICSTELSDNDRDLIKQGYDIRKIFEDKFIEPVKTLLLDSDKPNVKNLCWLIKNKRLDIKICIREWNTVTKIQSTLFHEKFGVFKDETNDVISFLGSVNESARGWMYNEESFEVSVSWEQVLKKRVDDKVTRFEKLWNGQAKSVKTYEFPDAIKRNLIEYAPEEPIDALSSDIFFNKENNPSFKPRQCQIAAKERFMKSNYYCLFQMATGSGKTKAALFSLADIYDWRLLLILVPGSELVTQWENDVKIFYNDCLIIKCSSDYQKWKERLLDVIQAKVPERTIIISTYDSAISDFAMDKWISLKPSIFALICDEAHNLGAPQTQKIMDLQPAYNIGLSATPTRNFDEAGTDKILNFFKGNTYTFSIREAIDCGYLVNYEYTVIPCFLAHNEWERYKELTVDISRIKGSSDDKSKEKTHVQDDKLKRKYMERSDLLKTADNKLNLFIEIINKIPEGSRILVYADSLHHLLGFARKLDEMRKEYFIYTGDKDSKVLRPKMLDEFKLGVRKILLAIGCLDEGVDIPVCDAAIFVSSSTSERQFIQRRGRVLRKSPGKTRAYVFDYLVIPCYDSTNKDEKQLAKRLVLGEYQRINLIASDAINGETTRNDLDQVLEKMGLNPYQF